MTTEAQAVSQLGGLAEEYFLWRAACSQPFSADDVPRCARPLDFTPDWSPKSLEEMLASYSSFRLRLRDILTSCSVKFASWQRSNQVDAALVAAQIERLRWEHTVLRAPYRNPDFYVTQALAPVHELLVHHTEPPKSTVALRALLHRMSAIPAVLQAGQQNLTSSGEAEGEFGLIALSNLEGRSGCCSRVVRAVMDMAGTLVSSDMSEALQHAGGKADDALDKFAGWLRKSLPSWRAGCSAVGEEGFKDYMRNVALVDWYSFEDMLSLGELELRRSQAMSAMEENRAKHCASRTAMTSIVQQNQQIAKRENQIREFLTKNCIFTVPSWLGRCQLLPIPKYLEPLFGLFSDNDMMLDPPGSAAEVDTSECAAGLTRFTPPPSIDMGFFPRSCIYDPRPQICHEGFPGHQTQLRISQRHNRRVRRHYLDSVSNEGIGTYLEEMLLHSGLFDDEPHTRIDIWRYYRLRVLRITADIKLGCGSMDIKEASKYLETEVPMDSATAEEDARMYLATPGLGLSYGVGKAQILRFLAMSRSASGMDFDLQQFHDSLWKNGNVPIELQAFEALGGRPPAAIARLIQDIDGVGARL